MVISLLGYEANVKKRVGVNQYAFELLKAIYKLDKENQYFIYLPSPPLPDLPPERKNWQYRVVGPAKLWNFFALPKALYQQKPKPDIVFNPSHYAPLFSPAPLIISIMDLGFLRYPGQFTKLTFFKLKFWTAFSAKRAAQILVISQSTKRDVIQKYQIPSSKITVTHPGYDKNRFGNQVVKSKIEKVKSKYKIKDDYLFFLSTLKPNKNIEGLLEAFKMLAADFSNLQLVIAGKKGWLFNSIFSKVKALGLEEKVVFTGFVAEKDVPGLIKGAKVFVMPSFWEGFGIPVVEAMASGVPVVVSQAGSLPEIAGQAGLIINPHKPKEIAVAIRKILKNKRLNAILKKRGLEQAKKFSWQKTAQKTLEVLEEIKKTEKS